MSAGRALRRLAECLHCVLTLRIIGVGLIVVLKGCNDIAWQCPKSIPEVVVSAFAIDLIMRP